MPAHATHDTLARMADDIAQLTRPIHSAIRGRIITHDPLLDQLRAAATPGGGTHRGPERRSIPASRPPLRVDAVDTLAEVYVGISGWHARLNLPSPTEFVYGCEHRSCTDILLRGARLRGPACSRAGLARTDWHKVVLRQLVGATPTLAPSIADWLAIDVQGWWRDAATASGWRPEDLIKLR